MVKQICILDDYQGVATTVADWSVLADRASVTSIREHLHGEDALVAALEPFQIVVAMRERTAFRRAVFARLPNLELLVTTGSFNAVIDTQAATDYGVQVCGTGGLRPPTTELTWALILACVKQLAVSDAAVRSGGWQVTMGGDVHGARLGLLGLGNYGSSVAAIGRAFGMDVVAWSQNLTLERCEKVGARLVSKAEVMSTSDVVSIHLVLSERTRGLVGAPELERMKPGAYLVNTSRGPIVDEAALVAALRQGRIAGAGLDVFETEPLPLDHPLRQLPNVILSPHMGYVTENSYRVFYGDAVADIDAFLRGEILRPVRPAP